MYRCMYTYQYRLEYSLTSSEVIVRHVNVSEVNKFVKVRGVGKVTLKREKEREKEREIINIQ